MDILYDILGNVMCIGVFAWAIHKLINHTKKGKEVAR